jgi:hypothetical protein
MTLLILIQSSFAFAQEKIWMKARFAKNRPTRLVQAPTPGVSL